MAKRIDRTGQEGINNFGSTIVITRYNNKPEKLYNAMYEYEVNIND